MKLPIAATLEEKATRRRVAGQIRATTFRDVQSQSQWNFAADALDADWNWLQIWLPCRITPERFECYSVIIENQLHGLMMLDARGRKMGGERTLVVDYLATNPRNRIEGQGFKYIGVCLMAVAVARSLELGMAGRVWLESLPDPRTLKFYESLGMSRQPQKSPDGYNVFAFEIDRARKFLTLAIDNEWLTITNQR